MFSLVGGTGLEPARDLTPTTTSTLRVCRFATRPCVVIIYEKNQPRNENLGLTTLSVDRSHFYLLYTLPLTVSVAVQIKTLLSSYTTILNNCCFGNINKRLYYAN